MRIEFCYGCGAPLEARWSRIVIVCRHCGSQNAPGGKNDPVPSSIPDDGRLRLAVDGRTYLILGLLGEGDSSDVYLGRWVRRLGEQVVIKMLRDTNDRDLLYREWQFLQRLHDSPIAGTPHFAELIPEPIGIGPVRLNQEEQHVAIYRWRTGFQHTLDEVLQVHPNGIDPRIGVWIFKRILEVLHWSHQSGVLHGSVLPPHVLIHPRDHGAMLIGWSTAMAMANKETPSLVAVSRNWKDWYPSTTSGSCAADIAMAARCTLRVVGGTFKSGGKMPGRLGDLLIAAARGEYDDAWSVRQAVTELSLDVFGPPTYCPLPMPGWPHNPPSS